MTSALENFILEVCDGDLEKVITELESPPYNLIIKLNGPLIMFKYSTLNSDMTLKECQQARGIIFDTRDWVIVSRPFDKFFNYGEELAHNVDFSNAQIWEKLDGSLIKFSRFEGKLLISTNGNIDAKDAPVGDGYTNFYQLVAQCMTPEIMNFLSAHQVDNGSPVTHMFELIHPETKIVINYNRQELRYLGSRYNATGEEFFSEHGPNPPKRYRFSSLEDCIEAAQALPYSEEGYIVCDKNFNRIKVKSPAYVRAHHYIGNGPITERRILGLVLAGETKEFLAYYPESEDLITKVVLKMQATIRRINLTIDEAISEAMNREITNRKEFAAMVMGDDTYKKYQSYLFRAYHDKKYMFTKQELMSYSQSKIEQLVEIEVNNASSNESKDNIH